MNARTKLSNLIKESEDFDLLKAMLGIEEDNENEYYLEEMLGNDGNFPNRNR